MTPSNVAYIRGPLYRKLWAKSLGSEEWVIKNFEYVMAEAVKYF